MACIKIVRGFNVGFYSHGYSFVNTSNNWIYMELEKTWKRSLQAIKNL